VRVPSELERTAINLRLQWEDPVRTFGSYMGLLVLLFGAHYLQLTQWALKLGATGLGGKSTPQLVKKEVNRYYHSCISGFFR
jgi:hypothetical protein